MIEIRTPTGSKFYASRHKADEFARKKQGSYVSPTVLVLTAPNSERTVILGSRQHLDFTDAWRIKPSGGIPVWQFKT